MSICYDLRFPELFRALADANCDIMVVPAAWYLFTGKDHWEVLVRARAIENQAYVIAACMSGRHPAGLAYGRSMVVNPWGTVLATAQDGPGYALAEADFDELARVRRELPALASRRLRSTASVRV
jgi:predicted amidohydrolase